LHIFYLQEGSIVVRNNGTLTFANVRMESNVVSMVRVLLGLSSLQALVVLYLTFLP
jgi:hypothetical protein